MPKLAASVIGAGVFGALHAKKYAASDLVDLKGIYDPNHEAALAVAHPLHAAALLHLSGAIAASDIVTIASPAIQHGRTALMAVQAGCHIYVEKPLATDMATADKILAAAASRNLVVAVGHQERAVFEAMGVLAIAEQPTQLHAVRKGTPSERNRDVSVALDLMIHDLDLALALTDGAPVTVEGEGDADTAMAEVTFDNGFVATFVASRVNDVRERTTRIVYPSGEVIIDFLERTFTNSTPHVLNADFASTPGGQDPLGASVGQFLAAVKGDCPRPLVTGTEAARALDLALAVEQVLA